MNLSIFLLEKLEGMRKNEFDRLILRLSNNYKDLKNKIETYPGGVSEWANNLIFFLQGTKNGLDELWSAPELGLNFPYRCIEDLCRLIHNFELDRCPAKIDNAIDGYLDVLNESTGHVFRKRDHARIWEDVFCHFLDSAILKSRKQHHLIHFVNHLSGRVEEDFCQKKLRRWVVEACKAVGDVVPPEPGRAGQGGSQPQQTRYLLIALSNRGKYFTVMAWLTEADGELVKIFEKVLGNSLSGFPDHLAEILTCDEFVNARRKCQHLVLELICPVELFNRGLEEFKPKNDDLPIGAQCCVVLRPLERFLDRNSISLWMEHWNANYPALSGPVDGSHIAPLTRRKKRPVYQQFFKNGQWVFLLSFDPNLDDFRKLFNSGVSIMLWPRNRFRKLSKMKAEIAATVIADLPIWLKDTRVREWEESGERSITPLSLLWDDPFRCPDDITAINHPDY